MKKKYKIAKKINKIYFKVFILFCHIDFSATTVPGDNSFISFILKVLLFVSLLIHTNIFNIINFSEIIKFRQKILNKKE